MAARAIHKKLTFEDKFARKYFCKHVRLGILRYEKRRQRRDFRNMGRKEIRDWLAENTVDGHCEQIFVNDQVIILPCGGNAAIVQTEVREG